MYEEKIKEIVYNFINNEGFEENQIESRVRKLIKEQVNLRDLNVYFVNGLNSVQVRVYGLALKESIKLKYRFDSEYIINSKRRYWLEKILNDND